MEPLITDYGFFNLKKLANVFLRYRNKNAYTPPEILSNNTDLNIFCNDFTIDSYSFGILLWEIYKLTQPFNCSMSALFKIVVEDDLRPEISKNFNSGIANLIKSCWDKNKEKRPDFNQILEILEQI
jgi:serine/threonine protein kinase